MVLQLVLELMAQLLEVCALTMDTPCMLNMTLSLEFRLEHWDDLGEDLNQFILGQHTDVVQKTPKARANPHQNITGGEGALSLVDTI